MGMGKELNEFVAAFQSGYKMVESKEEKQAKRDERKRAQESHDRAGKWGDEDREYRDKRAGRSDWEWSENRSDQKERNNKNDAWRTDERDYSRGRDAKSDRDQLTREGRAQENWEIERGDKEKEYQLKQHELDIERRKAMGDTPDDVHKFTPTGIPERDAPATSGTPTSALDTGDGSVQLASYGGGEDGGRGVLRGPAVAKAMVRDLQRDFGMPQHVAVGIVGQLAAETGGFTQMQEINPTVKGSRGGGGYAQWTGPRRKQFEEFAGRSNPDTYEENYAFLKHELQNTPEGRVLQDLRGASDEYEAGRLFTGSAASGRGFLRPGIVNPKGRDNWTRRVKSLFEDEGGQRVVRAASGGMISAIPDEEEEDIITPEVTPQPAPVATALPEEGPTPRPRPAYDGAEEGPSTDPNDPASDAATDDPYETGRRAVREGLKRAQSQGKLDAQEAIDDPERKKFEERYIRGYGAAPAQVVRQMMDKIDPDKEMAPAERNMLAYANTYRFFQERGEPEKAKEAAAALVQYNRQAYQQYSSLALAALEKGDVDNAAKAAVAAYANIPNGRDLKVEKSGKGYQVSVTDIATGKPITKQILSPQEMAAAAAGFSPATFDDEILNAAGIATPDVDEPNVENRENVASDTKGALEAIEEGTNPYVDMNRDAIRDIATDVSGRKGGLPAEQAVRFVSGLVSDVSITEGDDGQVKFVKPFTAKPIRDKPNYVEVTRNGQKVIMSKGAFEALNDAVSKVADDLEEAHTRTKKDAASGNTVTDKLRKFSGAFGQALQAAPQEVLPTDPKSVPMTGNTFTNPFSADAPEDPSYVPEPEPWRKGQTGRR